MRKLTTLTMAFLMGALLNVNAQSTDTTKVVEEESSPLTISGSVDVYYRYNLNADQRTAPGAPVAPPTSFANQPGFAVGMANVILAKQTKKSGFVADLVFGPRGDQAVFRSSSPTSPLFGGTGNPAIVNQIFAYWTPTDKLKFTIGKFNTFVGYEVISPVGNFNYSTSYLFSYGPFNHTGLKAQYKFSDKFSGLLGVFNATDFTDFSPFNSYTVGGQLAYTADKGSVYLNALYGDQDGTIKTKNLSPAEMFLSGDVVASGKGLFQVDLTSLWNFGDKFALGLNTSYNATGGLKTYTASSATEIKEDETSDAYGYYGAALYPKYKFSDNFSLGLRGEYFKEIKGGYGALLAYDADGAADVVELTLSSNIKFGNLTVIPELRYDKFSQDIIPSDGKLQNNLFSALVAAVYAF